MNLIQSLEKEEISKLAKGKPTPTFAPGDTLKVNVKIREGDRIGRGLYIAKHRGSACDERIVAYRIDDGGVRIEL